MERITCFSKEKYVGRDTDLRDTKKQKTPWNGLEKFPVEKRMNSEAAVHQKPLTQLPDSFDSPVIYGVRVETSNPYHLLISKHYIQNGLSSGCAYNIRYHAKSQAENLAFYTFFDSKVCIV